MSMTAAAAIGAAAIGAGGNIASQGPLAYSFGKRDRRDAAKVDFEQYKKQRIFDYQFDSTLGLDLARMYDSKDFDLARRYNENTASWTVEGLRRAGLNPILAAGNGFNASNGFQGQGAPDSSSMPHVSGNSYNIRTDTDLLRSMFDAGALDVQSSTAKKISAEADNIKAQTLRTYIDAINEGRHGGVNSLWSAISAFGSDLGSGAPTKEAAELLHKELSSKGVDTTADGVKFVNWLKHILPTSSKSAPTDAQQKKRFLSDIANATNVANAISPSPVSAPVGRDAYFRPKSPQELERERRLENGRKERGRIEHNKRKFGSVFKH